MTNSWDRWSVSIVQPKPSHTRCESVAGVGRQWVIRAGKVDKEVLGLDGPIGRHADLETDAGRPADVQVGLVDAAKIDTSTPIGETQRAVEQQVVDGKTTPPARGAEPGIGEFVAGENVIGVGQLDIGLEAGHELSELPIVSALKSARDSSGFGTAVGEGPPLEAEIRSAIESSPVPKWNRGNRVWRWGARRQPTGSRWRRSAGLRSARRGWEWRTIKVARPRAGPRQCHDDNRYKRPVTHFRLRRTAESGPDGRNPIGRHITSIGLGCDKRAS